MSAITGKPLTFGENGFTVPTGMRVEGVLIPDSADFEVTERCLMPVPFLYANGRVDEQNRIASPSWISLVLSTKKRDELLAGTATFAKRLLIGGAAASGVGAVVAAIGAVISQ
jgi:alkyl hydroperoxide reductase subunit AhpF